MVAARLRDASPVGSGMTRQAARRARAARAERAALGQARGATASSPGSGAGRARARPATAASRGGRACRDGAAQRAPARVGPSSTIRPAYMTAIRCESAETTARSCDDPDQRRAELGDEIAHLGEDLRLDRDVERGRRLVGDDHRRAVQERDRDRDALAHAAGELVRVGVEPARRRRGCRPRPAPSTERARAARAETRSCAVIASRIWSPMVSTGLSVIIGSWKTIAMRRPRTRRSASFGQADELAALEPDRAGRRCGRAGRRARGAKSPVTLLPEPDSPTRPSTSPRASEKETPSTAFTTPALVKKCVARFATSRSGRRHRRSLGLSWSRIWSPTRLIATMRTIERDAGIDRDPVAAAHHVLEAVGDQHAERRLGRRQAEAEEGQRRLERDGVRDLHGRDDDQRRQRVRQEVAEDDAARRRAASRRRPRHSPCAARRRRRRRRCGRNRRTAPRRAP